MVRPSHPIRERGSKIRVKEEKKERKKERIDKRIIEEKRRVDRGSLRSRDF